LLALLKTGCKLESYGIELSVQCIFLGLTTLLLLLFHILLAAYLLTDNALLLFTVAQVLIASLLALSVSLTRTIYRYRSSKPIDGNIPTVTVCIPARNETEELPGCIESVLASLYPKLEILVLDDCSQDKTPEIIKKYAHDGVRFIKGKVPEDNWLAKNSAYARLTQEASGDVLLFMGVDIRLKPESITEIIGQMHDSSMISILPKRDVESESSIFIQPIRYWWELGLWRFALSVPPVLSSCWAVNAEKFKEIGGFEGVKKAVEPETVFAKKFATRSKYAFLFSSKKIGVTSVKSPKHQFQTALRMRYVQLNSRPESVLKAMVIEGLFVFGPYITFVLAVVIGQYNVALISLVSIGLLSVANASVYGFVLRYLWPIGLVTVPFLVVTDWILMWRSMNAYEFDEVIWKERNICIPLLKVEKSLPKIN